MASSSAAQADMAAAILAPLQQKAGFTCRIAQCLLSCCFYLRTRLGCSLQCMIVQCCSLHGAFVQGSSWRLNARAAANRRQAPRLPAIWAGTGYSALSVCAIS